MDRTNGRLDAAVIAYRESPTEENRELLRLVAVEHNDAFLQDMTVDYMARTIS